MTCRYCRGEISEPGRRVCRFCRAQKGDRTVREWLAPMPDLTLNRLKADMDAAGLLVDEAEFDRLERQPIADDELSATLAD